MPGGGNCCASAGAAVRAAATGSVNRKAPENRIIIHPRRRSTAKPGPDCLGMKAHSRPEYDLLVNVICHLSGFFGLRRQNLLGNAVTIYRGREPAIHRDLP